MPKRKKYNRIKIQLQVILYAKQYFQRFQYRKDK